jgi:hypothetical protein
MFSGAVMHRFVAKENVHRLADQFSVTASADKRGALARLLIDEENKLGWEYEQLEITERQISVANILIRKQELLIESYLKDGYDTGLAREVLVSLQTCKSLFENYRRQIPHQVDGNAP